MQVFYSLEECKHIQGSAIALGNFDGVHLGHQIVIKSAVKSAKKFNVPSIVFTFSHHPSKIIGASEVEYLTPFEEKKRLLKKLGVDILVAVEFTKEFADTTREDFYKILKNHFNIKSISVGYNYFFGKDRTGNIEFLQKVCKQNNVELLLVSQVKIAGQSVSSSLIRQLLKENNIKEVNSLLGYSFQIEGIVIHGRKLGKLVLGFPTANVRELEKLLPQNGVFGVKVKVENDDNSYFGVMNVGNNPTLNSVLKQSVEVHIFDFDRDIYGDWIHVEVVEFIRNEEKLSGLEALKAQIGKDVQKFKKSLIENKLGV